MGGDDIARLLLVEFAPTSGPLMESSPVETVLFLRGIAATSGSCADLGVYATLVILFQDGLLASKAHELAG